MSIAGQGANDRFGWGQSAVPDRGRVETRFADRVVGSWADGFAAIWSARAQARYARIACSSGATPTIVMARFML
jgi:hypothetical protein